MKAVADWPTPTKVGDVRAFLGTAGYYRKFIQDFSRARGAADRAHQGRRQVRVGPDAAGGLRRAQAGACRPRPC